MSCPSCSLLRPFFSSPSFFFSCYGYHRDLHSFPTRRSSDLLAEVLRALGGMAALVDQPATLPRIARAADRARRRCARSEEHTSELQSHSDLVCRLLLEKKKQNISHDKNITSSSTTRSLQCIG